ncbi:small acid-soluble spore protein P [Paenibacillus doosanensis]|uniref:Acid-soluble spore protein P n=1 Tax=Paenibacillus konkukensis TaxID=2020716 RepID=A0ABY4RPU1_9BACL|nr:MULTISPECIES: small acid-soluble spore protein P [Paenibacillus]MCS7460030.1 small acid-soluble spore protein P [Paenibacillus doosanensis]UQZ84474.1 acid-soluble spore protein P [Paenibacillus konkukensis]
MPKDIAQPVNPPSGQKQRSEANHQPTEPLSGSKKVKQANHSRHNNGEG